MCGHAISGMGFPNLPQRDTCSSCLRIAPNFTTPRDVYTEPWPYASCTCVPSPSPPTTTHLSPPNQIPLEPQPLNAQQRSNDPEDAVHRLNERDRAMPAPQATAPLLREHHSPTPWLLNADSSMPALGRIRTPLPQGCQAFASNGPSAHPLCVSSCHDMGQHQLDLPVLANQDNNVLPAKLVPAEAVVQVDIRDLHACPGVPLRERLSLCSTSNAPGARIAKRNV